MSRLAGRLARLPIPRRLRPFALGAFVRMTGVRADEAELPLSEYPSIDAFFTRRLREGIRRWPEDPAILCSPVDGVLGQVGRIRDGRIIQAKGRWYTAAELLADPDRAPAFEGGLFITIYLSPRHYHRIHTPMPGRVVRARHIPGRLLPVHAAAVAEVDRLFARNERVTCTVEGTAGTCAVVAVGATNVGRISVAFDMEWGGPGGAVSNTAAGDRGAREYPDPPELAIGDHLMTFHLGSTVVLLIPPGPDLTGTVEPGAEITVGTPLTRPVEVGRS